MPMAMRGGSGGEREGGYMEVAYILGVLAVVCPRLALVLVLERRAARSLSRQPRGSIVAEKVIGSGRAGPGVGRGTARDKRSTGAGVPCAAWCMPDNAVGVMARGWVAGARDRDDERRSETPVRHAVADRTPDRVAVAK